MFSSRKWSLSLIAFAFVGSSFIASDANAQLFRRRCPPAAYVTASCQSFAQTSYCTAAASTDPTVMGMALPVVGTGYNYCMSQCAAKCCSTPTSAECLQCKAYCADYWLHEGTAVERPSCLDTREGGGGGVMTTATPPPKGKLNEQGYFQCIAQCEQCSGGLGIQKRCKNYCERYWLEEDTGATPPMQCPPR